MKPREKKHPFSYEVLDNSLNRGDAQVLARRFSCSPQHIRALCRLPETEAEFATGRLNFLDDFRTWIEFIRERDGRLDRAYPIGDYVCNLLIGSFVPHPPFSGDIDDQLLLHLASILKETSEVVEESRVAWFENSPGKITDEERARCVREITEAIVSLLQLKQWLESNAEG